MKNLLVILILLGVSVNAQQKINEKEIDSLLLIGRYQKALKLLSEAPETFSSQEKIASIYYQIDKTKTAIVYYKKALALKENYKARVQLGKAYQKLRDFKNAIATYEGIVENDPKNLLIKFQLGKLYLLKRRANKAIHLFKELENADATNPNFPYQRARGYALKKERDSMIDTFIKAYKIDSTHIMSIYQLASSFFKLRDMDSTFLFINQGLKVEPTHQNLLRLKVNQQFLLKQYKQAITSLKFLDSVHPNTKFATSMLGKSYFNSGNYDEAKKYFKKLKEIDRTEYKALTNLGHIAMKQEKYKEAMFNYRMASMFGKNRLGEEYFGLANAYLKMEKIQLAISMFEKAREDDPKDYKKLFILAKTSDEYFNDKKKVYKYYREYVFRFPDRDKDMTKFANRRISEIKKAYFMKGEKLN